MTIDATVDWVLANRRNKVFRGMTREQIEAVLVKACLDNGLVLAFNDKADIVGVVVARPDNERKELFIKHLLSTEKGAVRAMLTKFRDWYSGYTMTALRRDKPVRYENTERFVRLLEKMA